MEVVDKIVYELKSQGVFDQFRRECFSDVDTKPAYQNLRQRVEGSVSGFLKEQSWRPDMNKNQVREMLRKRIIESGYLETGVERVVDQVVNPKINSVFLPKVEEIVYKYLGVKVPNMKVENRKPSVGATVDLLPSDLESVSPEPENLDIDVKKDEKVDANENSADADDNKTEEDESPPFEPLDEQPLFIAHEENSVDSHMSGFSGLASHESNQSTENKVNQMEQDSQTSRNSSDSRLSIVTSDENSKLDIVEAKPSDSVNIKDTKSKPKSDKDKDNKYRHDKDKDNKDKHKSRGDYNKDKDKDRRTSKDSKSRHSSSSKDQDKSRDRRDSHNKNTSKLDKDREREKERRHSSSNSKYKIYDKIIKKDVKDKEKNRYNSSSSQNKDSKGKDRDKDSRHKDKSSSSSSSHKYSSASSSSHKRDKDKKKNSATKDDHYSSKEKKSDRRSTDRDSDGSHCNYKTNDTQKQQNLELSANKSTPSDSTNSDQSTSTSDTKSKKMKLLKPKCASNIQEALKLMKIRKQLAKLEKENQLNLVDVDVNSKILESASINIEFELHKLNQEELNSKIVEELEVVPSPLQNTVISQDNWDAMEAKLRQEVVVEFQQDSDEDSDDSEDDRYEVHTAVEDANQDLKYFEEVDVEKLQFVKFVKKYTGTIQGDKNYKVKNHVKKNTKRKSDDSDLKNNNKNQLTVEKKRRLDKKDSGVTEKFLLPLNPVESENFEKKDEIIAVLKNNKRNSFAKVNSQRYSSEDLYKPRPTFTTSRRRGAKNMES